METSSGSVFRPLSMLVLVLVLASRTCAGSHVGLTRTEREGLRGSSLSRFPNLEVLGGATHADVGSETTQGPRLNTGKLLKSMSAYINEEVSGCDLSDSVKACYNESTQTWRVDARILKKLKNDIQSIVECAVDGDKIHFFSGTNIKPPRTIVIDKDIMLGANSKKRASAQRRPRDVMPNVRLLCPDSGALIIAKSPSFTISNVLLKHCNGSTVIKVVPDCKDQRKRGVVTLQNLRFENVAANEANRLIEANSASCSELTMENIYLHGVDCGTKACITLPPHSWLKKMDLVGNKGGANSSIFSAEAQSTVLAEDITVQQNKLRILSLSNSSLTLTGSHFYGNGKTRSCVDCGARCTGGAIVRAEHSKVNVTDCEFIGSRSHNGGSLCISFSELDILNCTFLKNVIGKEGNGGAVNVFESPSVTITRTIFSQNRGYHGAALFSNKTSSMRLTRVKFWSNNSTKEGAVYLIGGNVTSRRVHFDRNKRRSLVTRGVSTELYNSTFIDNHAAHGSACRFLDGSVVLANQIRVVNNSASKDNGGAFEVVHSKMQIVGSQFADNHANQSGGAISVQHGELILDDTTFTKNNAGKNGGAIELSWSHFEATKLKFKRNEGGQLGGAVFIEQPKSLSLKKTAFRNNTGYDGGAMYVLSAGRDLSDLHGLRNTHGARNVRCISGGRLLEVQSSPCFKSSSNSESEASSPDHEQKHAEIVDCTFDENKAEAHGGALFLVKANHLVLSDNSFKGNKGEYGGAISVDKSPGLSVTGCDFLTNSVTSLGGSIYASTSYFNMSDSMFKHATSDESGGALYLKTTKGSILKTNIESNEARDQCGGVCVAEHSRLKADGLSLVSNSASNEGGGLLVDSDSTFLCYQCTIRKNKATGGAGMFVLPGTEHLVTAQLQDSVMKSNVAREYGGGMVLAPLSEMDMSSQRDNKKPGYVVLLNTDFLNNKADISGAAIMSPTLDRVLFSCNDTIPKRDFLKQDDLEMMMSLDQNRPCGSWGGNILTNHTSDGGAITTSPTEPTVPKWAEPPGKEPETSPPEVSEEPRAPASTPETTEARPLPEKPSSSTETRESPEKPSSSTETRESPEKPSSSTETRESPEKPSSSTETRESPEKPSSSTETRESPEKPSSSTETRESPEKPSSSTETRESPEKPSSSTETRESPEKPSSSTETRESPEKPSSSTETRESPEKPSSSTETRESPEKPSSSTETRESPEKPSSSTETRESPEKPSSSTETRESPEKPSSSTETRESPEKPSSSTETRESPESLSSTTAPSSEETIVSPRPPTGNDYVSLSVDPNSDVEIIGDIKSGFTLINAKSGTRLPEIHITIEHTDSGLPSANPGNMLVVVHSPNGYIPGRISVPVEAGHGVMPRIAGFVPPGNYTLIFNPQGTSNDANTVYGAVMTIVIRECEIGEVFDEEDGVCQECDAGSYSIDPNSTDKCIPCPKKATCEGRYIVPNKGKWHKTPCHGHMKDCIYERACSYDDRKQRLTEFTRDVTNCAFNESAVETYGEVQCSKGYAGQLCGSCKDSHGLSSSFRCFKCPHKALSLLLIVASICYLAAIVVLITEGYVPFDTTGVVEEPPTDDVAAVVIEAHTDRGESRRSIGMPDEEVPQTREEVVKNPADRLKVEIARIRLTENLKILFNFLQTISLAALINVRWTTGMIDMFRFTDHVSAASVGAVYWPLSCVFSSSSVGDRAVLRMVLSLLVPVFAIVVAIVLWRFFTRKAAQRGSVWSRLKLVMVAVTYISYVALTKVVIGAFYCVEVNDSVDPLSNSESKYWALDTSMKCMKGSHSTVVGLAIAGLILVTVCFPIISSLAALAHANDASAESLSWIFGPLSFLYTAFKKERVLWETFTMIRKVVLIVIVIFGYPLGGQAQGILAFIVLISAHYLQTAYRPYRNEIDSLNDYESRSLLICSLVFAFSLFFNIRKCSQAVRCCATILVAVVIVVFVIFLLYKFVKNVFEAMKAILQYGGFYVIEGTSASSILDMYLCANVLHTD